MNKLTKEQQKALLRVYNRDKSVAPSYLAFRRRAFIALGDVLFINWKGMSLGIETDGYTHS